MRLLTFAFFVKNRKITVFEKIEKSNFDFRICCTNFFCKIFLYKKNAFSKNGCWLFYFIFLHFSKKNRKKNCNFLRLCYWFALALPAKIEKGSFLVFFLRFFCTKKWLLMYLTFGFFPFFLKKIFFECSQHICYVCYIC